MKCIIPSAGHGKRMAPITNAIPKELAPVGDAVAIDHSLDESDRHFDETIIVSSREKPSLNSYVDDRATVIYQESCPGLGGAIIEAHEQVGLDGFFGVILPDELIIGDDIMYDMIHESARGLSSIGVMEVSDPSRYGIVSVGDMCRVQSIVEKPKDNPPSNLGAIGRYVLSDELVDFLKNTESVDGEIPLTDAIQSYITYGGQAVYKTVRGSRYDCGSITGYMQAQVDFSKRRLK